MTVALATAADVKRANRRLYDAVADAYERLDGRRNDALGAWVRRRLARLADVHGCDGFLDLGSGTGIVARCARGVFRHTTALDLSPSILSAAGSDIGRRVAADLDALPIADASVNVVACFAVLHHLYDTEALAREVARVLKPGGSFWSDHDMDARFYRRFRWPLGVYRRLRGAEAKYAEASPELDAATYALAEFRENGVDGERFMGQLAAAGLSAWASYHWFGLTGVTNRLFGERAFRRGWAPLLSVTATKPAKTCPR